MERRVGRSAPRLVIGLGNPGTEYEGTRHNVGFAVVERLARHEGLLFQSPSTLEGYTGLRSFVVACSFDPEALLVKPETFVNRSGEIVAPIMRWAGTGTDDLMQLKQSGYALLAPFPKRNAQKDTFCMLSASTDISCLSARTCHFVQPDPVLFWQIREAATRGRREAGDGAWDLG